MDKAPSKRMEGIKISRFPTTPVPANLLSAPRRQRNGRAKDVAGIVAALGLDQPFGVAAVAGCGAVGIIPAEEIRIPAGQRRRKGFSGVASPLPMLAFLEAIRSVGEACEHFDEHGVAAAAEGGSIRRHT